MSSSSQYRFNDTEDPNDAGALRKALSQMKIGLPETFGGKLNHKACYSVKIKEAEIMIGRLRNLDNKAREYNQFNLHTPPDITERTRIIAVLGVTEQPAPYGNDGWFVSDFFAFWNIFQGVTERQTWYHCLDIDSLVAKHTRYLHGNPYKQRKVVLDENILAESKQSKHPPQQIQAEKLKLKTKNLITAECKDAESANENVLILLFGHGDRNNHGIVLGRGGRETLKIGEFKTSTKALNTNITLITTSCYSGGWTCNPQLNLSTMTAAGDKNVSLSWRFSGSTGRACGSMFTTALIQKLTKVGGTDKTLGDGIKDDDITEHQEETYAEFTRTVHEHLLKGVDRRGYEHQLSFGAQDDAWTMCWRERTGIPLGQFKKRWDNLKDWEKDLTLHPGDPMNRDPSVTEEQLADYLQLRADAKAKGKQIASSTGVGIDAATGSVLGKRKTSALYGGTDRGLLSMVSSIGAEYLRSQAGIDDSGDDGGLHNTLRWIRDGREVDIDRVEEAHKALEYRMTQMSTADGYVRTMDISAPKGQLCCEYNTKENGKEIGMEQTSFIERLIFDREILFPPSVEAQGRPFYKGMDYLVAALHHADIPRDLIVKKLDDLAATLDQALEQEKEVVKQDPEVSSKRRRLFHSFGVALESISPKKRRSRGLSLTGNA